MKNFFFNKLRIPCAPPDALVDELRAVAMHYQRGSVPEEVKAHIARVLANLTEILETKPDMPPAFLDLAKIPMFPVSVPSAEGIVLRKIDQFYVPDKTSKYADVLRGRVAILALPESAITPIRKLLGSSIFKNKIRYLEDHVTVRSMPLGRRVLDMEATSSYSSRVEYIARYTPLVEPIGQMLTRYLVVPDQTRLSYPQAEESKGSQAQPSTAC